ncbi:hypothetical protein [Coraliomargarita parva]|uniref:hypothetical protein n=1 Tax=Coraliomargarita parva TaxID=3014050 RepID=UPI0022B59694|nr:hypothetical protein [Coraliomargarita parva]
MGWFLAGGVWNWQFAGLLLGATFMFTAAGLLQSIWAGNRASPALPASAALFLVAAVMLHYSEASRPLVLGCAGCLMGYAWTRGHVRSSILLVAAARAYLLLLAGSAVWGGALPWFDEIRLLLFWSIVHFAYMLGLGWISEGGREVVPASRGLEPSVLLCIPLLMTLVLLESLRPEGSVWFLPWLLFFVLALRVIPALPVYWLGSGPMAPRKAIPRLQAGSILIDALALSWSLPELSLLLLVVLLPLRWWLSSLEPVSGTGVPEPEPEV